MKSFILTFSLIMFCLSASLAQSDDTSDKIIVVIQSVLSVEKEKITLESELIKDLGAEDYDITVIAMNLEFEFNIKIPEERVAKFVKVKDIIDYFVELKI